MDDTVGEIAAMADPVLRNLCITQRYHEFAVALRDDGCGDDATWCAFAVWASKTAGATIRGYVPPGSTITVYYYGEFAALVNDTDENGLTASQPDVVIYGALELAGDYFTHDKWQSWGNRFSTYLAELGQLALDVDGEGGPTMVASAYPQAEIDYE